MYISFIRGTTFTDDATTWEKCGFYVQQRDRETERGRGEKDAT
jgi:hypothetical protein